MKKSLLTTFGPVKKLRSFAEKSFSCDFISMFYIDFSEP